MEILQDNGRNELSVWRGSCQIFYIIIMMAVVDKRLLVHKLATFDVHNPTKSSHHPNRAIPHETYSENKHAYLSPTLQQVLLLLLVLSTKKPKIAQQQLLDISRLVLLHPFVPVELTDPMVGLLTV